MIFIIIRIAFVILVVVFEEQEVFLKALIFTLIQLTFVTFLILSRPFKQLQDNIIEIMNQVLYLTLASTLMYFNSKKTWDSTIENIYIYIILAGPTLGTLILFFFLIKDIFQKLRKCKKSPQKKVEPKMSNMSNLRLANENDVKVSEVDRSNFLLTL